MADALNDLFGDGLPKPAATPGGDTGSGSEATATAPATAAAPAEAPASQPSATVLPFVVPGAVPPTGVPGFGAVGVPGFGSTTMPGAAAPAAPDLDAAVKAAELRQGTAEQRAMDDPELQRDPELQAAVLARIRARGTADRLVAEGQRAQAEHAERAERLVAEAAFSHFYEQMWAGRSRPDFNYNKLSADIMAQTAEGGAFYHHGQLAEHLIDRIGQITGDEGRADWGADYDAIIKNILSDPGTEGHIGRIQEITEHTGHGLTLKGEQRAISIFNSVRHQDELGIRRSLDANETMVKDLFEKPPELMGAVDPAGPMKGQQFVTQYEAEFDEWRRKNPGKSAYDFLRDHNRINQIAEQVYPTAERTFNRAGPDQLKPGEHDEVPAPIEGVNPDTFKAIITHPPANPDFRTVMPMATWKRTLEILRSNETPAADAVFNRNFGPALARQHAVADAGNAAAEIRGRLNAPYTPPPPPQSWHDWLFGAGGGRTATAAPPAPEPPPAPPAGETAAERSARFQRDADEALQARRNADAATAAERSRNAEQMLEEARRQAQAWTQPAPGQTPEQYRAELDRQEALLTDNLSTFRRQQEDRSAEPGARELAARRGDAIQAQIDAIRAARSGVPAGIP